jgi:hypothetical protein
MGFEKERSMFELTFFTTAGRGWPQTDGWGINATQFLYDNTNSVDTFPEEYERVFVFINKVAQPAPAARVEGDMVLIADGASLPPSTPITLTFFVKEQWPREAKK